MGTGVLAVALCSQLAIPTISAVDMGGLTLPANDGTAWSDTPDKRIR